jgi:hypoxanthine phosphoribosyltransferase
VTDKTAADAIDVLFDERAVADRVEDLAQGIAAALGPEPLIVAVLKGSFVFTADLIRALHRAGARPFIDFMQLSSYGAGTESSGRVEIVRDVTDPLEGRDVLIVDDILESGRTLAFARDRLLDGGARRVKICVLLDKAGRRVAPVDADFVGFDCPDRFVVGYGLDYAHRFRELPFIGVLRQDPV